MNATNICLAVTMALVIHRVIAMDTNKATPTDTTKSKIVQHLTESFTDHALTGKDEKEMRKTKDCSTYKPPKRIQCDISLFYAKLITATQAQDDINKALIEWKREQGNLEHIAFLSVNLKKFGIGIGMAESMTTTWYYEIPIALPRFHRKQYMTHAKDYRKPVIVHSLTAHEGNDVIDHWYSWTAIEGVENNNILYVQGSKNTVQKKIEDDCSKFLDLPKSLRDREHVSIILGTNHRCATIPSDYEQVVGEYKEITINGLFESKRIVPVWECDLRSGDCFGDVDLQYEKDIQYFLGQ